MADAAQPSDHSKKKLFCTSQRLSLLTVRTDVRPYLSGERFWQERQAAHTGERAVPSPWAPVDRRKLVQSLTAAGDVKRLAVVCAAGLGKSTNLEWLAKELAAPATRQTPFLFRLDDGDLPANRRVFWQETLPAQVADAPGNDGLGSCQLQSVLGRLRADGRITLLLDSIDQAGRRGLSLVKALLRDGNGNRCPIVVSARPHAIFEQWDDLIGAREEEWRFVRIEPLVEDQQRLLLNQDGDDRYTRLPPAGLRLLENPRTIEYIRKCDFRTTSLPRKEPAGLDQYALQDLRTGAHVFAGAVQYMVECGMEAPGARRLGLAPGAAPSRDLLPGQADFAHNLLAALAYTMYCGRSPGGQGPNVSHVPAGKPMELFLKGVRRRLVAAGVRPRTYTMQHLHEDLRALGALNTKIHYDLLDTHPRRRGDFRWYDRSLQEFYSAWWLSRFADAEDLTRLRRWRYDDPWDAEQKSLYEQLWGFLVETPRAVRRNRVWVPAVGVLWERGDSRCCEMIHRSWPALKRSKAGRDVIRRWRQEFRRLLGADSAAGDVARQARDGLRLIPAGCCPYGADPLARPPRAGAERPVAAFRLHCWPVTNEMYELFQPKHFSHRWESVATPHPLASQGSLGDGRCPVVNVTWANAWCFAAWCGCRLPTELEWEHAVRAGAATAWFFGNEVGELEKYAHYHQGWKRGATCPVGSNSRLPNPYGLYDMLGNVWEWCLDPWAPADPAHVIRGGSWVRHAGHYRSAWREKAAPGSCDVRIGFRLAADAMDARL